MLSMYFQIQFGSIWSIQGWSHLECIRKDLYERNGKLILSKCFDVCMYLKCTIIRAVYSFSYWPISAPIGVGLRSYLNGRQHQKDFLLLLLLMRERWLCPLSDETMMSLRLYNYFIINMLVKLVQSVRHSLMVHEVASSSPVRSNALMKIECAWNPLGQGTYC